MPKSFFKVISCIALYSRSENSWYWEQASRSIGFVAQVSVYWGDGRCSIKKSKVTDPAAGKVSHKPHIVASKGVCGSLS